VTRRVLLGLAVIVLLLFLVAPPLRAPGPADFYIEPMTSMRLVALEPGTFTMGSPATEFGRGDDETRHPVTFTRKIYLGQHEVTQAEWKQVMGVNPSRFVECARCPVETVDFFQVNAFLSRLNAGNAAMRYRLPTEAEWEYACRAGTATAFSTGRSISTEQANYDGRFPYSGGSQGGTRGATTPVGSYPSNAWGLFDMHGNVWEWTADWYGEYPAGPATDPDGPPKGKKRVIRGGSWNFDARSMRCAARFTHAPQDKGFSLGFRIVAEPIKSTNRRQSPF
jgi:formylglycine-generating enzyme required for sulfatase activity